MPIICQGCWLSLSPLGPVSGFLSTMDPSFHPFCKLLCASWEGAVFLAPSVVSRTLSLHTPSSQMFTVVLYSSSAWFYSEDSTFLEFWGEKEVGLSSYWILKAEWGRKCISGTHSSTLDYIRIHGRTWQESSHLTTFFFCSFSLGKILKDFCFSWKLLLTFFFLYLILFAAYSGRKSSMTWTSVWFISTTR